ncbi:hypothetical protein L3Q82_005996 [Scortum barcoo]|uniref:Uncharacterized protein n=1 Tax=Scortum barcoo TaxID=214431 RepID=A0ACB8X223_9TELE|nr:hypothetical protein L3Q82_005996 [Scortum barcoo]
MSEHREEFLLEIEAKLFGLTVKELHRICEYCKIAGKDSEGIKNKTRRALVKHIVKFCEREEFLEREDEGMSVLLDLNDALGTLREDPAATDNAGAAPLCSPPAADDAEEETGHPEQPASGRPAGVSTPLLPVLATLAVRETARDEGTRSRGRDSISNSCWAPSGFRKDFRINGHVGESMSKDPLSFSSLEHQIESGIRKGYPEEEIIEAVIRAVNPGLKLRSYLEGKTDLTLVILRQILRAHYAEQDATVLYQQLTKAVQETNETALDFLIRVLDLRQKVLFTSEHAQSGLKYNKDLAHSQCCQSIMTGLSNDNIRSEMRMYLQDEHINDELLLQRMQIAQYNENERVQKIKTSKKITYRANLSTVEGSGDENDPLTTTVAAKPNKPIKENPLFAKLEESNTAIRELTGQLSVQHHHVPSKLVTKLRDLGLNSALCDWILNFLTGRPQAVRMGSTTSSTLTLNTGAPQGCVLSPLLYSLFTHDCVATHSSNTIIKFADIRTVHRPDHRR